MTLIDLTLPPLDAGNSKNSDKLSDSSFDSDLARIVQIEERLQELSSSDDLTLEQTEEVLALSEEFLALSAPLAPKAPEFRFLVDKLKRPEVPLTNEHFPAKEDGSVDLEEIVKVKGGAMDQLDRGILREVQVTQVFEALLSRVKVELMAIEVFTNDRCSSDPPDPLNESGQQAIRRHYRKAREALILMREPCLWEWQRGPITPNNLCSAYMTEGRDSMFNVANTLQNEALSMHSKFDKAHRADGGNRYTDSVLAVVDCREMAAQVWGDPEAELLHDYRAHLKPKPTVWQRVKDSLRPLIEFWS